MQMANQLYEGDLIKWQLDPNQLLMQKEKWLLGFEIAIKDERPQWIQKNKPLMTSEGAKDIISLMANWVNKETILSDLDDDSIIDSCQTFNMTITSLIGMKWMEWQIDKNKLSLICRGLTETIYIFLNKAKNKNTLDFLKPVQRVEQHIEQKETTGSGGGLLGIFNKK